MSEPRFTTRRAPNGFGGTSLWYGVPLGDGIWWMHEQSVGARELRDIVRGVVPEHLMPPSDEEMERMGRECMRTARLRCGIVNVNPEPAP